MFSLLVRSDVFNNELTDLLWWVRVGMIDYQAFTGA